VAGNEVFSKNLATVNITFNLRYEQRLLSSDNTPAVEWKMIMKKSDLEPPERPNIFILRVIWEYWNGQTWSKLFAGSAYEDIFIPGPEQVKSIQFRCPEDMEVTMVNNQSNYWIRARVLSIHNLYAPNGVYEIPRLEQVSLSYQYEDISLAPNSVLSLNNLEFVDHLKEMNQQEAAVKPLRELEMEYPATYLGFEQPPRRGPLGVFLSLRDQTYDPDDTPALDWEYSSHNLLKTVWSPLDVIDKTDNLSSSGIMTFSGPPDLIRLPCFGKDLYWLRVANYDAKFDRFNQRPGVPGVQGIYMNTVRLNQRERAENVRVPNTSR